MSTVTSTATETASPPRPKRWIPVSLKVFAAILAFLGAATLWIGLRAYRQYVAMTEIERLGGTLEALPRGPLWLRSRVGDVWMKPFDEVGQINLADAQASDSTLSDVSWLPDLERLILDGTRVTDTGLVRLGGLHKLKSLSLKNTPVTDAGLVHLKRLRHLKELSLEGTNVTDAGLVHLHGLTDLISLALDRSQVTDAGLLQLQGLTRLDVLYLDSSQATKVGLGNLELLKKLNILWIDNIQVGESGKSADNASPARQSIPDLVGRLDAVERRSYYSHDENADVFEAVLREIIDQGGSEADKLLSLKLNREASELELAKQRLESSTSEDGSRDHVEEAHVDRLSNNLELLTALRRVQKRPDPLSISVALPSDLKGNTRALPTFSLVLKSVDVERIPVWVQKIPHFHGTHREAQWRFEVRNQAGDLLQIRPNNDMFRFGGGIKSDGWLRFGEMLTTTLPMGDFIDIPEPGEYTVTITYHPKLPIADTVAESELSGLITFRSVPFKLTVEQGPKRVIGSSKADRARALPLIRNLPDLGIVKIVGGTYDADDYEFIEPDSPAGQLLMMGWRAVPTLLESLDDEHLSAHRKAWVLSLLHSITAERDLDPVSYDGGFGNGVLPGYERRSGKYFGGSSSGGQISPRQQERLILKWRTFASEYLDLQEVNDK